MALSPRLLACPRCGRLVHADALKSLAARAEAAASDGRIAEAVTAWREAIALLPHDAPQSAQVGERIEELLRRPGARASGAARPRRAWSGLAGLGLVSVLLAGLTKLPALAGALGMFGVLWSAYGWKLAAGVLVALYVHELGHAVMMAVRGMTVSAPMFVPGLGAYVRMNERPATPGEDNRIGLAGPAAGLAASLASWGIAEATGARVFLAIAAVSAIINLLNLTPVWQLDGARGFASLTRRQRAVVVAAFAVAFAITGMKPLLVPLVVSAAVALGGRPAAKDDAAGLAWYLALIASLTAVAALAA